jgi:hypothetical protein
MASAYSCDSPVDTAAAPTDHFRPFEPWEGASGCALKNVHSNWSALMAKVVGPTSDRSGTMVWLPAQIWPSPFSRYNSTVAFLGQW